MGLRAGLLTQPIKILTPQSEINEYGEKVQEYKLKYTTRARVLHDNGTRENNNGEIFYPYQKTFNVRGYVPVDEFDLIEYKGKRYRITTIDDRLEDFNDKLIITDLIND